MVGRIVRVCVMEGDCGFILPPERGSGSSRASFTLACALEFEMTDNPE